MALVKPHCTQVQLYIIHYTAHAEDKKLEKLLRVFFLVGKSHMNRIKLNHFLPSVRFAGGFSVPLEIP